MGFKDSIILMGSLFSAESNGVGTATSAALIHVLSLKPGLSQPVISLVAS